MLIIFASLPPARWVSAMERCSNGGDGREGDSFDTNGSTLHPKDCGKLTEKGYTLSQLVRSDIISLFDESVRISYEQCRAPF